MILYLVWGEIWKMVVKYQEIFARCWNENGIAILGGILVPPKHTSKKAVHIYVHTYERLGQVCLVGIISSEEEPCALK